MKAERYCFVDVETTGANPLRDHVVAIGALVASSTTLEVEAQFYSLVRPPPGTAITEVARQIHGLSDSLLEEAPHPSEVIEAFFRTLGDEYAFAGWNVGFDVSFVRSWCADYNASERFSRIHHRHLDVQSVATACRHAGLVSAHLASLDSACTEFGLGRAAKHNALEDAVLALEVYKVLLGLLENAKR
jgi:DNA polymerase-3 subunit epsilon